MITAIASETPAEKLRRWHIVVAICAVGFAAGVLIFVPVSAINLKLIKVTPYVCDTLFLEQSQLIFVHLLDHYVIGRLIVATTILELIGFAWIYGNYFYKTNYHYFHFLLTAFHVLVLFFSYTIYL